MTKKRKRLARRETTAKNTALHHNYRHTIATYRIASLLIIVDYCCIAAKADCSRAVIKVG
jgi:hypothetical protein